MLTGRLTSLLVVSLLVGAVASCATGPSSPAPSAPGVASATQAGAAGTAGAVGVWIVPRTEFGHPDLQGNWTNASLTPVQRPGNQGRVLTQEQVDVIEGRRAADAGDITSASDPDRAPPEAGGTNPVCIDSGTSCYNEVYRDPGDRVAVVNGEPRSSFVTIPENGRIPPVTPEAQRLRAEARARTAGMGQYDHPELRPVAERCLFSFGSNAGPPMFPNGWYNNNYTIVQTEDHVMILVEMVHDVRIIKLEEGPRLPSDIRFWTGDSFGHWEGDTLVVETTNFHPLQQYGGNDSETMKVVERFTRTDQETILYEFLVDDPRIYTAPWGGQVPMKWLPDQVYEYACHEGNYAMTNILQGARYQERLETQQAPSAPR